MTRLWPVLLAGAALACFGPASAQELSSSIMRPSVVDPTSGVVQGRLPGAGGGKTYYLSLDLEAGSLTAQLKLSGPSNGNRRLTLQFLDPASAIADSISIRAGFGTLDESAKTFAIDSRGRRIVRLIVEGEENGAFCVLLGGTALPNAQGQNCASPQAAGVLSGAPLPAPRSSEAPASTVAEPAPQSGIPAPPAADAFSTSILRPTPINPATAMVAGALPGAEAKSFYLSVDLKAGNLLAQMHITGRAKGERRLTLERLDAKAAIADRTFVRSGFGTRDEVTKVFPIDASGRHVFRLTVAGDETGAYCVLFGGTALPSAQPSECPAPVAAARSDERRDPTREPGRRDPDPVAAPPRAVEVIVSKCQERLRVRSDFLFDFDRADLRPEAAPALDQLAQRIAATDQTAVVEGHTDGKGTDAYNQTLSERRAASVRDALVQRGLRFAQLAVRGFGKTRAVAPNQNPDGSDDPEGRQKNRRVEVVLDTCK
jgi:outer membrane protein OmpA-like peptidoglycan-associated protein